MITIGICDTDEKFIEELIVTLREEALKKNIECKFSKFNNSESLMKSFEKGTRFDIIFLETHIGKECGVILGRDIKIIDRKTELIYLSSTKKYVLDCFDMGAFNYILKPLGNKERLLTQFERLLIKKYRDRGDYLNIHESTGIVRLQIKKISYIETVGKLIRVHYEKNFADVHERIGELEEKLSKLYFIRCHKSYLVNARHILKVEKDNMKLDNGEVIPISRLRLKNVKETLNEFIENKDII